MSWCRRSSDGKLKRPGRDGRNLTLQPSRSAFEIAAGSRLKHASSHRDAAMSAYGGCEHERCEAGTADCTKGAVNDEAAQGRTGTADHIDKPLVDVETCGCHQVDKASSPSSVNDLISRLAGQADALSRREQVGEALEPNLEPVGEASRHLKSPPSHHVSSAQLTFGRRPHDCPSTVCRCVVPLSGVDKLLLRGSTCSEPGSWRRAAGMHECWSGGGC